MERMGMEMQSSLATPADAEIILRLYELRREEVMRKARAWVIGEFWPASADDYFAVIGNGADPHNPWLRQVVSYWEMAASMVLHGAVSAELFVDCNAEGFFLLASSRRSWMRFASASPPSWSGPPIWSSGFPSPPLAMRWC